MGGYAILQTPFRCLTRFYEPPVRVPAPKKDSIPIRAPAMPKGDRGVIGRARWSGPCRFAGFGPFLRFAVFGWGDAQGLAVAKLLSATEIFLAC